MKTSIRGEFGKDRDDTFSGRRRDVVAPSMRWLHRVALFALAPSLFAQVGFTRTMAEQRQQRVENCITPAVIISGESATCSRLADRMRVLNIPGVSIAVIHEGKIEWAHGYGVVDRGGCAVTPDTLFQAASISKAVSAVAVMVLVQRNSLNLDTNVNDYLKSWKVPDSTFTSQYKVTLRGLLSHTAGVAIHGFRGYAAGETKPGELDLILNGQLPANNAPIRVDAIPGQSFRYSGGGYTIIQQLHTDVTGKPFPSLMSQLVLSPLGMTHSSFGDPPLRMQGATLAQPYQVGGKIVTGGPYAYPELAAAGLWTTPSDLARFAIGVQGSYFGRPDAILSKGITATMLTPILNHYGLGLTIEGGTSKKFFAKHGANVGYTAQLVAYESEDGAIIMTNSDNGDTLASEILRTIAVVYGWPDWFPPRLTIMAFDPVTFDKFSGIYRFASGEMLTFWREQNRVYSRIRDQPGEEMLLESTGSYFVKSTGIQFIFESDKYGHPVSVVLTRDRERFRALRSTDLPR